MTEPGPAVVNPDLQALHTALVHLVRDLNDAIGRAKTSAEVIAIANEISDVNARVTSLGNQLLTQQTEDIKRETTAVLAEIPTIEKAIKQLDDVQKFIQTATEFLKVVDKAIGVAKLVI